MSFGSVIRDEKYIENLVATLFFIYIAFKFTNAKLSDEEVKA